MYIDNKIKNFNPAFFPYDNPIKGYKNLVNKTINLSREITKVILEFGSDGVEVNELQEKLIKLNYLKGNSDGYFGRSTEQAVLNFQKDANLVMDGIVGPDTWALLNQAEEAPLPVNEPIIKLGDENLFVTNLQLQLKDLGYYSSETTGNFNQETENAVKDFQRNNNLTADGIVGPKTWRTVKQAHFNLENPIPTIIKPMLEGTTGEDVEKLQIALRDLGYYQGEITGTFDISTGRAVQSYQEAKNLIPTGIVNQITWESIIYKENENNRKLNRQKSVLSRPTIRTGATGEDVTDLQIYLKQLNFYNGVIDGQFGSGTNSAVRSFQNTNNLLVDGVVGRNTWSSLIHMHEVLPICQTNGDKRYVGVVIDPGHGGADPGAVSPQITEKNKNLQISSYMAERFNELGIPYALTRSSDETLSNLERIRRIKEPFGDISNAIVISNHINAGGGEGAEVIYPLRSNPELARNILTEIGNAGQKTRTYYQKTLPNDPSRDYYYIMRDTDRLQTLIIEYGFLDNPNDIIKLQNNWERYAEAVVKAVAEYMDYPYTLPDDATDSYTVRPGDTLWSIAQRYNMTVDQLKKLNNLISNNLSVGQQLIITSQEPDQPSETIYVVQRGDTLWSIANRFGTTVPVLRALNNLTSDSLSIGQRLLISGADLEPLPPTETIYVVKRGDTLWSIANRFGTTVPALRTLNNLTNDSLSIGQRLLISGTDLEPLPQIETIYVVRRGDTLWSIANQFGVTVDSIRRLNNLTTNTLSIGQNLIISKKNDISDNSLVNETVHVVQAGDTLWSIAKHYNTTVDELRRLNNLTSNNLTIGHTILVKDVIRGDRYNSKTLQYIVTPGETLWTISKHFKTTVQSLKLENNLINNRLETGQTINIPLSKKDF